MSRLFFLILTISVGSCAGVLVIATLTMGYYTARAILTAGILGAAIGVAVAWIVARMLHQREVDHHPENPEGLLPDNPFGDPHRQRPPPK